jgi:hypothetical protein
MRARSLRRTLFLTLVTCAGTALVAASEPRTAVSDRQALVALEDEWLVAHDAPTLDRILAADFVHPVPAGVFLTKAEHIDWVTKHLPPPDRKVRFDRMDVRLYGDVGIVNGTVVASDGAGKELERSVFTDVFAYREGRWQAVNAEENRVEGRGGK